MSLTKAEDLRNGDLFTFRDECYVCLMSVTDERTSQTVITALPVQGGRADWRHVVGLRLLRQFKVEVSGRAAGTSLEVLHNTREECLVGELAARDLAALSDTQGD